MTPATMLAWAQLAPAVAVATALVSLEARRAARPASPLFAAPAAYSLADAIERQDLRQAYQFIQAGADPSGLIAVRHPALTGERALLVSPLVWAVAAGDLDAVLMLLGSGARLERPMDRQAACLATLTGRDDIAGVLQRFGAASGFPCAAPAGPQAAPVLPAFVAGLDERVD